MNTIFRRGNIQREDQLGKGCPFILKIIFYQYRPCVVDVLKLCVLVVHGDATELHKEWYVDKT